VPSCWPLLFKCTVLRQQFSTFLAALGIRLLQSDDVLMEDSKRDGDVNLWEALPGELRVYRHLRYFCYSSNPFVRKCSGWASMISRRLDRAFVYAVHGNSLTTNRGPTSFYLRYQGCSDERIWRHYFQRDFPVAFETSPIPSVEDGPDAWQEMYKEHHIAPFWSPTFYDEFHLGWRKKGIPQHILGTGAPYEYSRNKLKVAALRASLGRVLTASSSHRPVFFFIQIELTIYA